MNELLLLALFTFSPPAQTIPSDTVRTPAVSDSAGTDTTRTAAPRPSIFGAVEHLPVLTVTGNPAGVHGDSLDPAQGRRKAIAYSDWYGRRLVIHRVGSYTMLPLFATEYWLGNKLMNDLVLSSWVRPLHGTVASGIGILFAANTITGVWNFWDSRHDPADRTRRTIHTVAMLAADAGFLWSASLTGENEGEAGGYRSNPRPHKNAAIASIGVATVGTAMMWFWRK